MKRAIGKYLGDFLAIIALFVLALGVGGYILTQQRLRFPFVEEKPFKVKVELPNAQAVQPGQGQTVRVAGVQVGDIGEVELEDGLARGRPSRSSPSTRRLIKKDATALLRTKTGLKDMFLEVDPGRGEPMEENETIQVENSQEDVDQDEILSALDADTRDYLKLLISGAGKGLNGRGGDLQETFARLGPLHRDLDRFSTAVARRRGNLKRLIHNYGLLTTELGNADRDIVKLVGASNEALSAFAAADQSISESVAKLPGALRQTEETLRQGRPLRRASSARRSRRCARPSGAWTRPTARCCRWCARPRRSSANQIRPFTRATIPFVRNLGRGRQEPEHGAARPGHRLRRAQPLLQHRRLQPRRRRGPDRQPGPGPRPPGGLPVHAGLGGPGDHLAVLHRRRPGPAPALLARRPALRRLRPGRRPDERPGPAHRSCCHAQSTRGSAR